MKFTRELLDSEGDIHVGTGVIKVVPYGTEPAEGFEKIERSQVMDQIMADEQEGEAARKEGLERRNKMRRELSGQLEDAGIDAKLFGRLMGWNR